MPTRPTEEARPVGLLAGSGRFPIAFAEKAREVGLPVVCVGLGGIAPPACGRSFIASIGRAPSKSAG